LLIFSCLICLIRAGYQYEYWLFSTSCSGNPFISYRAEGDCGLSTQSDANEERYVKITLELGTGDYTIYEYKDKGCTDQARQPFKIKSNELDKCISENALSSYRFKIFFVCFPGDSNVLLSNNQNVKLTDLKVGQSVASYGGNTQSFSEVYTFLDYQKEVYLDFLELHYLEDNGKSGKMALSFEHLILAKRSGPANFVQAKDVRIGDYIFKNFNGTVSPVIVSDITVGKYKGAIAPATMDGTVIVNDIVVSSYAVISHNVGHAVMAPLRLAYKISPSLVTSNTNGMNPYAQFFYDRFSNWITNPLSIYASHSLDSN